MISIVLKCHIHLDLGHADDVKITFECHYNAVTSKRSLEKHPVIAYNSAMISEQCHE